MRPPGQARHRAAGAGAHVRVLSEDALAQQAHFADLHPEPVFRLRRIGDPDQVRGAGLALQLDALARRAAGHGADRRAPALELLGWLALGDVDLRAPAFVRGADLHRRDRLGPSVDLDDEADAVLEPTEVLRVVALAVPGGLRISIDREIPGAGLVAVAGGRIELGGRGDPDRSAAVALALTLN